MAKKKLPKELDSIVKEVQALSNELKEEESKIIPITEREGYWDFPLSVEIEFFDPLYSYELTGYKPINETQGLEFVAQSPQLLTLGIKPNRPETGYGYIQIDDEKQGNFYKVKTFIEKPQLEFAQVFVESDEFYWNSGIFLWNVDAILEAFNKYMPEISSKTLTNEEDFASCPNISIDYGVMEKAENVYVQLCNFGWADLGTWGALHEASPKDQHKNVIVNGHTMLYDCRDNIIAMPKGKLAVVQGLEDYLVADTNNVLLICKKDDESTIRRYVNDAQIKLGDEFV